MPRSKMNKLSSSTCKNTGATPSPRRSGRAPATRRFSLFQFPFAVPSSLRTLLRLAAAIVILAQWPAQASPGSLWKAEASRSMFADKRARAVGDVITIVVQENTTASKDNSTKTSKSSSVDAAIDTFLYAPGASGLLTKGGQMPAMRFGGSQSFDGGGKINNSERITSRVAVKVVDTLPNGNMIIEGRRETHISGEKQEAILRGVVRSEDIMANNTVFSYNVAEASIKFLSKGTLTDNQRKGWLFRVWEKVTPF